tara:strand:- start:8694 stop:10487 length:1794 start_codon:yes stop_codon:yes gene_type:complete
MADFLDLVQKVRQDKARTKQAFAKPDTLTQTIDILKYIDTRDRESTILANAQVQNIPNILNSITDTESYNKILPMLDEIRDNASRSNKTSIYVPYINQLKDAKLSNISSFDTAVSNATDYINKIGKGEQAYQNFDEMTIDELKDEIRNVESIHHNLSSGINSGLKNNKGLYADKLLLEDMNDYMARLESTTKALLTGGVITPEEMEAIWLGTEDQYITKRTEAKTRAENTIKGASRALTSLDSALTRFISAKAKNSGSDVYQGIIDEVEALEGQTSSSLEAMTPASFEAYINKQKKVIRQTRDDAKAHWESWEGDSWDFKSTAKGMPKSKDWNTQQFQNIFNANKESLSAKGINTEQQFYNDIKSRHNIQNDNQVANFLDSISQSDVGFDLSYFAKREDESGDPTKVGYSMKEVSEITRKASQDWDNLDNNEKKKYGNKRRYIDSILRAAYGGPPQKEIVQQKTTKSFGEKLIDRREKFAKERKSKTTKRDMLLKEFQSLSSKEKKRLAKDGITSPNKFIEYKMNQEEEGSFNIDESIDEFSSEEEIKTLQKELNKFARFLDKPNQAYEIKEDGVFGTDTEEALINYIDYRDRNKKG